jgi:hypothetical protein
VERFQDLWRRQVATETGKHNRVAARSQGMRFRILPPQPNLPILLAYSSSKQQSNLLYGDFLDPCRTALNCFVLLVANHTHMCRKAERTLVLTMLKWSCVDNTVVRRGCSSRVGREFPLQPLLSYVSRKLRTDAGVWSPCAPRTLVDAPVAFQVANGSGPRVH